jgi:fructokinase
MFVACGEALWDLFAAGGDEGEGGAGLAYDARPGGSPFSVAVGLARLGQPSALLAGLSTDRLGQRLAARLCAEGVATRYLVRSARPTTVSLVDLDAQGVPTYSIYGEGAADRAITRADLPALGPAVWGVHAASFALVAEPIGASLLHLFERERGRRLLTLDLNVRLGVEPDAELWRRRIDAFCRMADLVKLSIEDLHHLYPGAEPGPMARAWLEAGAGLVVVTRGAAGAEAFAPGAHVAVAGREVPVADTVGAGDAFQAALIAGLAEQGVRDRVALDRLGRAPLAALIGHANTAAAIACTRRGAELAYRAELPPLSMEVG